MAKPPLSNKRDNEKKRATKRLEKQQKKEQRKANGAESFEDMLMYVDENGMLTDVPPGNVKKEEINMEDIIISTPKKEESEKDELHKGRVEHFNSSKGYGFIKELSSIEKYFFHISSAPQNIAEGDIVFFELERGAKGMNAVNIKTDNE